MDSINTFLRGQVEWFQVRYHKQPRSNCTIITEDPENLLILGPTPIIHIDLPSTPHAKIEQKAAHPNDRSGMSPESPRIYDM